MTKFIIPNRAINIVCILIVVLFMGASCGVSMKPKGEAVSQPTGGGVYKSNDQGKAWEQVVFIEKNEKRTSTIATLGIQRLYISPIDNDHIYAQTKSNGLYETINAGAVWKQTFTSPIQGLAIHPSNKAIAFLASDNKILKTIDGGTNWETVHIDPTPQVQIVDLGIINSMPKTLYAVTSKGVLLRSDNEGASWRKPYTFKLTPTRLFINQSMPRVIYLAATNGAIWRSGDGGDNWIETTLALRDKLHTSVKQFRALSFIPNRADAFLYANQMGIYRTYDGGVNWEEVKIVTTPSAVNIAAVAVNPKRADDIYYVTPSAFYHSNNNGLTWSTLPLPTNLIPSSLIHHSSDGRTLYLGFSR